MRTRSPDLVGREGQVARIEAALADAAAGRGSALFLVGEAGIGKTRLLAAATGEALHRDVVVLRGRSGSVGTLTPLRPLTEALLAFSRDNRLPDLTELGPYRGVLGHLVPEWSGPEAAPALSTVVLGEALLRLLTLAGRERGTLLAIDDLHDADAETLAVLEYLLDNLEGLPVLLIGSVRSGPSAPLDLLQAAERRGAGELIPVPALSTEQTRALIASCLETTPDDVPAALSAGLAERSAGNPFFVEELLHAALAGQQLAHDGERWQLTADLQPEPTPAVVRSVAGRTDELGEQSRELLSIAAVLGRRFPLTLVQDVAGVDDGTLLGVLHGGVAAELVEPDEPSPDWYAFRHPLTVEALLGALTPTEGAALHHRAAEALENRHPDLADDWCQLAASLRERAGDDGRAGALYLEAGQRAVRAGATESAVRLLERAHTLLRTATDPEPAADALAALIHALGERGQYPRAAALTADIDALDQTGLPANRVAALYAGLASAAYTGGQWAATADHLDHARDLLGADPADADLALIDVTAAQLALQQPGPDRLDLSSELAARAAAAAERAGLPAVACEAWQLLGVLARSRDLDAAHAWFARAREHAATHGLRIELVYADVLAAGTRCLADGGVAALEQARDRALQVGAIPLAHEVDGILGLQAVLQGRFTEAADLLTATAQVTERLKLHRLAPYLLIARATLAAHRADRERMQGHLDELLSPQLPSAYELPLSFGLARTFCALLEENAPLAAADMAQTLGFDADNPTTMHLSGRAGLALLLGVLAGRSTEAHLSATERTGAAQMRWNAQFLLLARAVLHGRAGRVAEATAAAVAARERAEPFPLARHLGARLVAEAAHADGWGEPETWLREAEEHFHQADLPLVAGACRALLRGMGRPVRQRREGREQLPADLRALGVTGREGEVLTLLAERIANKEIAARLHISPRTVEKHVASLLLKTGAADRTELARRADPTPGPAAG